METIVLGILLGMAVVTLGVVAVVQTKEFNKGNMELQKLLKSRDLEDYRVYGEDTEDEEIGVDDEDLVELDRMDEVVNERE